jgi:peptidoglycan/xylan/chitin deacetylase (PgdA/CDA1 family)
MKINQQKYLYSLLCASLLASAAVFLSWSNLPPVKGQIVQMPLISVLNHPKHMGPPSTLASRVILPVTTARPTAVTPAAKAVPAVAAVTNANIKARILMYHYVRDVDANKDPLGYRLSVHANELDAHLQFLQSLGYHTITMQDVVAGKGDSRSVVLTFDDGYEDFYTTAFPIIKKYGFTATAYIITNKIGGPYMSWDQVREVKAAGFEIGDHTADHLALNTLSAADQRHQIIDSKHVLEEQIGSPVTAFCYPSGRYNDQTLEIVKEAGYTSATTTNGGSVRAGADPFQYVRIRMNPDMSQSELHNLFQ